MNVAAGIDSCAGVMGEDLIERMCTRSEVSLKFFQCAERRQLAHVHDGDAIAMAFGVFEVMSGQEESGTVFVAQVD